MVTIPEALIILALVVVYISLTVCWIERYRTLKDRFGKLFARKYLESFIFASVLSWIASFITKLALIF